MKIKVSDATDTQLDWLVAKCEGLPYDEHPAWTTSYKPSTNWVQGGPILEREKIAIGPIGNEWWGQNQSLGINIYGLTPLTAVMRCYVVSELGYEVEVPKELA